MQAFLPFLSSLPVTVYFLPLAQMPPLLTPFSDAWTQVIVPAVPNALRP